MRCFLNGLDVNAFGEEQFKESALALLISCKLDSFLNALPVREQLHVGLELLMLLELPLRPFRRRLMQIEEYVKDDLTILEGFGEGNLDDGALAAERELLEGL